MSPSLKEPRQLRQRELIQFIAKAGLVDVDVLVNRYFRKEHESLLEARPRAMTALKRLALQEYLQVRPVVLDAVNVMQRKELEGFSKLVGKHYFTLAYCITPRASRDFNSPLPPTLRENFVQHHIKTMRAIVEVEKEFRFTGSRVVDFKMESQLVRETFKGKVFDGNQQIVPKFPDAMLTVRGPDGTLESVNVEYVTSKYTDEMIREKQREFVGRTVWAADTARTAERIAAVTGQPAFVV